MTSLSGPRQRIAVIGAGISGLSAAWLLSRAHDVTVFEREEQLGGHSCTVDVADPAGPIPVDMGFIVYNEAAYPNLTALFAHLGVATAPTDMSLSVTLDGGRVEYSGDGLGGLFAQPSNLLRPRFWRMIADLVHFYRSAPALLDSLDASISIGRLVERLGYSRAFSEDHLLPMAGAIWSASARQLAEFPARSFLTFYLNHELFTLGKRAPWRTVRGGSRVYVRALMAGFPGTIKTGTKVTGVVRGQDGVAVMSLGGHAEAFDQVVIAAHADQALAMLTDASGHEQAVLSAIPYVENTVVLHGDASFMPARRRVWSSWNTATAQDQAPDAPVRVTYWMNRLQPLDTPRNLFVTLNPDRAFAPGSILQTRRFSHPVFSDRAMQAQDLLNLVQGRNRTWFCGAWAGWGFHEDGLQAGLGVAEAIGGVTRPWTVPGATGRVHVAPVSGVH